MQDPAQRKLNSIRLYVPASQHEGC